MIYGIFVMEGMWYVNIIGFVLCIWRVNECVVDWLSMVFNVLFDYLGWFFGWYDGEGLIM